MTPALPSLSEADVGKMEAFLENILVVLPAVRVDMFIQRVRSAPKTTAPTSATQPAERPEPEARFVLENRKHGLTAYAVLEDGEFVIEQGSQARLGWASAHAHGYSKLHAELKSSGVLIEDGERCVFAKSYAFQSPSAAAAVVDGRPANGTTEWVNVTTRQTYKEWEAGRIDAITSDEVS